MSPRLSDDGLLLIGAGCVVTFVALLGWSGGYAYRQYEEAQVSARTVPPVVEFSGESPRGAYAIPGGDAEGCLVRIVGESPSIWYYHVWRGEDPANILTGHGPLAIHETPPPEAR